MHGAHARPNCDSLLAGLQEGSAKFFLGSRLAERLAAVNRLITGRWLPAPPLPQPCLSGCSAWASASTISYLEMSQAPATALSMRRIGSSWRSA
jgi:hypothetical protein